MYHSSSEISPDPFLTLERLFNKFFSHPNTKKHLSTTESARRDLGGVSQSLRFRLQERQCSVKKWIRRERSVFSAGPLALEIGILALWRRDDIRFKAIFNKKFIGVRGADVHFPCREIPGYTEQIPVDWRLRLIPYHQQVMEVVSPSDLFARPVDMTEEVIEALEPIFGVAVEMSGEEKGGVVVEPSRGREACTGCD
jgi:hypothetical protein